jgi:glycosyltransferase involved in cell wall biosynthesis
MILIESFRHGTPVLARRLGPFPEIVERSGGGELFDSSEELLASMRRLQQDAGRRLRLSRAGSAALHDVWSEAAVVPQYLDVIRRVAVRRGLTDVVEALGPPARDAVRPLSPAAAGIRV